MKEILIEALYWIAIAIAIFLVCAILWIFRAPIIKMLRTSLFKRLVLDFFILVAPWLAGSFVLLVMLLDYLSNLIFKETLDIWFIVLGYLVILFLNLEWFKETFTADVEANMGEVYTGLLTATFYPKLPGFNWRSPLQKLKYTYETRKDLEVKNSGDAEARGAGRFAEPDSMSYGYTILYKVLDTHEGLTKYAKTTPANVQAALILTADIHVIDWLFARTASDAKSEQKQCLTADLFDEICEEYGIKIQKCGLNDLDFSKEVREFKKSEAGAMQFKKTVALFMEIDGLNVEEAMVATKLLMNKDNFKEIKLSGNTGNNSIILNQ